MFLLVPISCHVVCIRELKSNLRATGGYKSSQCRFFLEKEEELVVLNTPLRSLRARKWLSTI